MNTARGVGYRVRKREGKVQIQAGEREIIKWGGGMSSNVAPRRHVVTVDTEFIVELGQNPSVSIAMALEVCRGVDVMSSPIETAAISGCSWHPCVHLNCGG